MSENLQLCICRTPCCVNLICLAVGYIKAESMLGRSNCSATSNQLGLCSFDSRALD